MCGRGKGGVKREKGRHRASMAASKVWQQQQLGVPRAPVRCCCSCVRTSCRSASFLNSIICMQGRASGTRVQRVWSEGGSWLTSFLWGY